MKIKEILKVKTQNEARQLAIDWQNWASKRSISYSELSQWLLFFETLAEKFGLKEEFLENGII